MRRTLGSAALAVSLALTLGACASDSSTPGAATGATPDAATSSAPVELTTAAFVTSMTDALHEAGSYAFTYSMTASGTTVTGNGRFVGTSPETTAMAMTTEVAPGTSIAMILVDGKIYMDGAVAGSAGKWIDLTDSSDPSLSGLADQLAASGDPTEMISKLSGDSVQITRGERSTVDGVEVTAYTMALDVVEVSKATGQEFTDAQIAELEAAGGTGMDIVYLIDDDGLPVELTTTMGDLMTQTMTYSGYGAQEPVTAPAPETIISAAELGL